MNFDNAQQQIDNVKDQIGSKAEAVKDQLGAKAEEIKSAAGEKVTDVLDAANGRLNSAGEKISEVGAKLWEKAPEGIVGDVVGKAAAQVESAGEFLADATIQEMSKDLAGFVRKHPLQSLAAGLLVGGLVGMAFSRARGVFRS